MKASPYRSPLHCRSRHRGLLLRRKRAFATCVKALNKQVCALTLKRLLEPPFGFRLQIGFDCLVCLKDALAVFGKLAAVRSVAVQQLHVKRGFGIFDDAPCFAVGHAHAFCRGVQRSRFANTKAQTCDASSENRVAVCFGVADRQPDYRFESREFAHAFTTLSGR